MGNKLFTVYPHLRIVFISGFAREYISEVFIPRINLAGFIEKPIDRSILERTLEKIQNDNETRQSEVIKVNSNGRVAPNADITCYNTYEFIKDIHSGQGNVANSHGAFPCLYYT